MTATLLEAAEFIRSDLDTMRDDPVAVAGIESFAAVLEAAAAGDHGRIMAAIEHMAVAVIAMKHDDELTVKTWVEIEAAHVIEVRADGSAYRYTCSCGDTGVSDVASGGQAHVDERFRAAITAARAGLATATLAV